MRKGLLSILFWIVYAQFLPGQGNFPVNGPLYTDTIVPRIDIIVNPDTLNWIYSNPESDLEFHAKFVFDNGTVRDTIDNIGFRLRGNTSRYSNKKSFKISFNTFLSGGKYYGVEKLNLNGEHNDPSIMRSKVMWDILRLWGIPAPRANHVQVFINGNYYGLYISVEHIDEEFVMSRFGNNDGNLYKCLYPGDLDYRGSDPDNYKFMSGDTRVYELKTNEETDDYSDLAALVGILTNSQDNSLVCDLGELFNTYDWLKVIAADIFCGNWDGYIFNKNNYYLYHNTATGKFEYIPYDVDNTFGIDWFGIDWAERDIYSWQPGGSEMRPLYNRVINLPELRQQFTYYASQLVTNRLDIDSLVLSIEARRDMIAPYVVNDPYYPLDWGYTYSDFLNSYSFATGAHVKYGLFPYLYSRNQSMSGQLEDGIILPVIKYIRHRRDWEQQVKVIAQVETDQLPVNVVLMYSVNGGVLQEEVMTADGDGSFSVLLGNISGETKVEYQVKVTDGAGQMKVLPCDPATVNAVSGDTPLLFINEFMADNSVTVADEIGNYSDWIEIYNGDTEDVYLGDKYLTDNLDSPNKWQMPATTLPPGGFELFWADGNPALGDHHAGFKLGKEGEEIGIFSSEFFIIDSLRFGGQSTDVSYGRLTDGATEMVFFETPTPGKSNSLTPVREIYDETKLIVYPNPAPGTIVWFNRVINCRVFSSSGLMVFSGTAVGSIDTGGFVPGIYYILSDDGSRTTLVVY